MPKDETGLSPQEQIIRQLELQNKLLACFVFKEERDKPYLQKYAIWKMTMLGFNCKEMAGILDSTENTIRVTQTTIRKQKYLGGLDKRK